MGRFMKTRAAARLVDVILRESGTGHRTKMDALALLAGGRERPLRESQQALADQQGADLARSLRRMR